MVDINASILSQMPGLLNPHPRALAANSPALLQKSGLLNGHPPGSVEDPNGGASARATPPQDRIANSANIATTGFLMVGADNADSPFRFEFDYFEKQERLGDNVFDPAWAWQQCFQIDGTYSLEYLRHPYLEHAQEKKE